MLNLSGQRFESWEVLSLGKKPSGIKTMGTFWECKCTICGENSIINGSRLVAKRKVRCRNCHSKVEKGIINGRQTHEYYSWRGMKERCFNPNHASFGNYGGKGVTVCKEWKDSFPAFLRDMGKRPAKCSLDRIDPEGNYEPGNCRWVNQKTQANNKSQPTLTDDQISAIIEMASMGVEHSLIARLCFSSRSHIAIIANKANKK
jgi:hypothetical protein